MSCDFTEEVSLLVDGELPPSEAARLRAHLEGCASCIQARDSFLLLRQELRSYERVPDPHAQSKTLAAVLDSRTSVGGAAAPSAGARAATSTSPSGFIQHPRGAAARLFGGLAAAFSVRRLRPAHAAASALLLIATALGVIWLARSNNSNGTRSPGASASANVNGGPIQAAAVPEAGEKRPENSGDAHGPTTEQAKTQKPPRAADVKQNPRAGRESAPAGRGGYRAVLERREELSRESKRGGSSREAPRETASVEKHAPQPSPSVGVNASQPPSAVAAAAARRLSVAAAADPSMRIGRHAERVERLLRSFRNARLTTDDDPTLAVADARRLSKRLLYTNIALRREAVSAGDLPAEGWLDSLEPILVDISNLPDKPSHDAVGSIKDRIRRRQLVGVLQAQAMLTSRP